MSWNLDVGLIVVRQQVQGSLLRGIRLQEQT